MATETALRMIDAPEGLTVEGYSMNPADESSAANAVMHYIMRHWDDIARAAVLFERTAAIAPVPHRGDRSPFTVEQPTHASLPVLTDPRSYMGANDEARGLQSGDEVKVISPFVSGQGGDFGGGGASSSWSDSPSSRDSDAGSSSGGSYSDSGSSSSSD